MTGVRSEPSVTRRDVVAGLAAAGAAGIGGCLQRLRAMTGWRSSGQVSLRIRTLPTDSDPYALDIARAFAEWLQAAGIDARVVPEAPEELFRNVLVSRNFDLFVARAGRRFASPDALYSLLHSKFVASPGWHNPFGYADFDTDELLETQRRTTGAERRAAAKELQRTIARSQPFTVVCFPDDVRAGRNDRYTNWRRSDLGTPEGYLALRRTQQNEDGDLRVAITDPRVTVNLNPLAPEFRDLGLVTGFLYDPIGRRGPTDDVEPWLADSWSLSGSGDEYAATIRLREDLRWHDGEPLTAEDVAFTYEFLADTSGDEVDDSIPAPRFQGAIDLVDDVTAVDRRTVEMAFGNAGAEVALTALTVPLLPEHVWTDRMAPASFSGIEIGDGVTEALVTSNVPPVGSGPLRFVEHTPDQSLVLERFEDHFLARDAPQEAPPPGAALPSFDRLLFRVVGSDVTAVDMVASGEMDATGSELGADTVPRIGREEALDLVVNRSTAFYLIGYNARRSPLTNPQVRNVLGHLVDKAALVEDVFEGYATPAASPLDQTPWLPADLRWEDADPVTPFYGTDGELDAGRARDAFRDVGYRYEDGELQIQ